MMRFQHAAKRTALAALVFLIVLYSIFPFFYAIVSSMKVGSELFDPRLLPPHWHLGNYAAVLTDGNFLRDIVNSVVVACVVVAVSLLLGVGAAYALGRIRFSGRRLLLISILGVEVPESPEVSLAGIKADAVTLHWTRPVLNKPVLKYLIHVNGVNGRPLNIYFV